MFVAKVVPCKRKSSFQKVLMKSGSWSEKIVDGNPWRHTISLIKTDTTCGAENCDPRAENWALLERRSTTTRIVVLPVKGVSELWNPMRASPRSCRGSVRVEKSLRSSVERFCSLINGAALDKFTNWTPETRPIKCSCESSERPLDPNMTSNGRVMMFGEKDL